MACVLPIEKKRRKTETVKQTATNKNTRDSNLMSSGITGEFCASYLHHSAAQPTDRRADRDPSHSPIVSVDICDAARRHVPRARDRPQRLHPPSARLVVPPARPRETKRSGPVRRQCRPTRHQCSVETAAVLHGHWPRLHQQKRCFSY